MLCFEILFYFFIFNYINMKVICTQDNLVKGLNIVSHIAGKNISLPILNNVLLKTDKGIFTLISTNLDIGIKTLIRGKIEESGELTVNAKLFNDYINLLDSGSIELNKQENNLIVKTDEQESIIHGQEADDYPILPEVGEIKYLEINPKDFKEALSQVIFSASYDEVRPELSGVLFQFNEGEIIMAATDSYRLAEKKIKVNNINKLININKIIPLRVLQEISRILDDNEKKIMIGFNENQVVFKFNETTIISRLIEGNYPDYKEIIPEANKTKVLINRLELIKAVKTASLFSKTGINDVFLEFNSGAGNLVISAVNTQLGKNKSVVKAEVEGENNSVLFNFKYLTDGLQNINGKKVRLELNSADMPVILKPEEDQNYLYLIMPIRK